MKLTIKAPAKINLYLNILGKRNDGYHNVEMIMQSIDLADTITIMTSTSNNIEILNNVNFITQNNHNNTAYLAAKEFFEYINIVNPGIKISIEKKIPTCAGLGGGSADAAAVLIILNKIFNTQLSKQELMKIGENVGADVPFCLVGGTMLATKIGTTLTSLQKIPECYIILVKPKIHISTKVAYENADKIRLNKSKSINDILLAIKNRNLKDISKNLYNKFETVMKLSEVDKIKYIFQKYGALGSSMSGSGSAVFGIFENEKLAKYCKYELSKAYNEVFLTKPTSSTYD